LDPTNILKRDNSNLLVVKKIGSKLNVNKSMIKFRKYGLNTFYLEHKNQMHTSSELPWLSGDEDNLFVCANLQK
jgi:hypothetical protein